MTIVCDTVVIGAGFAGLSTAYYLALEGMKKILVIERDNQPGLHASGKNAGMIRQTVADRTIARLARAGCRALEAVQAKGWKRFHFEKRGSLLLAKKSDARELRKIAATARAEGIHARLVSAGEATRIAPFLQGARFDAALFCPTDAFVDIHALLGSFVTALNRRGVKIFYNHPLRSIQRVGDGFVVHAGGKKIRTERIINAAGAWANLVAQKAGVVPLPLKPYRRHLYVTGPLWPSPRTWPFVWDISHEVYFRPLARGLLLSPCDKVFVREDARSATRASADLRKFEKPDPSMKKILLEKLNELSPRLPRLDFPVKQAAFRTITPDGRFVVGEDPKLKGFYWVAGLGGHGVTTCFSVGELAARLILGKKVDPFLKNALKPSRFMR